MEIKLHSKLFVNATIVNDLMANFDHEKTLHTLKFICSKDDKELVASNDTSYSAVIYVDAIKDYLLEKFYNDVKSIVEPKVDANTQGIKHHGLVKNADKGIDDEKTRLHDNGTRGTKGS